MRKIVFFLFLVGFANVLNGEIRFTHRVDDYSTHQPVLFEMAMRTEGPIIEFGCGNGSTDLLHEICKKNGRLLISIDDDFEWLQKFSQKYRGDGYEEDNSGWHKFFFVPGKNVNNHEDCGYWIHFLDNCQLLKETHFDLCFVDQSPWLARIETIKRFKHKSRYIILHDCDFYPVHKVCGKTVKMTDYKNSIPGIYDFSDLLPHFKLYYPLHPWPLFSGPPTLLGSEFESDFPDINYNDY
ncbi:MAG TPA: hypothetical protein VLG49_00190 [Rhabdochlamydiaceae bacterium]|nr:hypothetical protein [Rhabdochlamydiaceae bacterium]